MTDNEQLAEMIEWAIKGFEGFMGRLEEYVNEHQFTDLQKRRLVTLAERMKKVLERGGCRRDADSRIA